MKASITQLIINQEGYLAAISTGFHPIPKKAQGLEHCGPLPTPRPRLHGRGPQSISTDGSQGRIFGE